MGSQQAAGKTGTTENFEDAWFVGYTPYLSTAVWMGNPDEKITMRGITPFGNVTGGSFPAVAWGLFNAKYHENLPERSFPYCPRFAQEGDYLRIEGDPEEGTDPCPDQISLDYLSDEEIDACEDELPEGFEECDYEYDYLDDEAVRVTVYCGDPPPEEEGPDDESPPDETEDPEAEEEGPDDESPLDETEDPEAEEDSDNLSNGEEGD